MSQSNVLELDPATFIAEQNRQEADEAMRIERIIYKRGPIGWAQALKLSHLHTRRFSWHVRRLAESGAVAITEHATGGRPCRVLASLYFPTQREGRGVGRVNQV